MKRKLRAIVLASLAVPPASLAACGSRATSLAAPGDASSTGETAAPWECAGQACSGDCPVGTIPTAACVSGALACSCTPTTSDAGATDATADARGDVLLDGEGGGSADGPAEGDATGPCDVPHAFCTKFYQPLFCTADSGVEPEDGGVYSQLQCTTLCGLDVASCSAATEPGNVPAVLCYPSCSTVGRKPEGLAADDSAGRAGGDVGRYFASASYLEAASVFAFRRLRAELSAHGAPSRLQRGAAKAEREEVRHARATASLARREGVCAATPPPTPEHVRSLEALAMENAVEGCVRETMGAVVAAYQAATAEDPTVRRAMRALADDELRHAVLGWEVAAWASSKLDAGAARRVKAARTRAVVALRAEHATGWPLPMQRRLGLPGPRAIAAMLDGIEAMAA